LAESLYALGATVVRRLPREISLTAISTMATLERTGPRRITELSVVQGVSQPSMTSLVSGLERAGYVERRRDPTDARAALVAITPDGLRTLKERRRAGTESMATLVDKLSGEELGRVMASLPVLQQLVELDQEQREGRD
jgi:DNA-binding MarR family transcriptional regulator